jgi:uncharacterized protein YggE
MMPTFKDQRAMYILMSTALVVLTVFLGVSTWNKSLEQKYIGKPSTVRDTISLSGEGKVSATPTLALVQFGVMTQSDTPAKAQSDNASKMNAVQAAMKQLGIQERDIETSGYTMYPNYDYSRSSAQPPIVGYTVQQNVSLKVRDFNKISQVLERGIALGINQVSGVSFTIDEPKELQAEARLEALKDAKKKAEALAEALGVDIVRVVSFSEASSYNPPSPYAAYAREGMGGDMSATPSLQPGTQEVYANVTVTYEIR